MKDILENIIAYKRLEVARQKEVTSIGKLACSQTYRPTVSMRQSLEKSPYGIIAEFKRKSPSKGFIKVNANAAEIPVSYEKAGASALSILTDEHYFGGNLNDIATARTASNLPILRKDFVIDEYQLYQANAVGANAVLLIAAAIDRQECKFLTDKAHDLKLEVLLEIHHESELDYITPEIDMIGINNRNLGSFQTDIQNSFRLATKLPTDRLLVSESGISDTQTIRELRAIGFRGFLIGESFMKHEHPGNALAEFINKLKS